MTAKKAPERKLPTSEEVSAGYLPPPQPVVVRPDVLPVPVADQPTDKK